MKATHYFSHDSNARHDYKIQALRSVYGVRGYGMYWIVIEMMREQKDYSLPLSDKIIFIAISREFECSLDEAKKFIHDCIYEFGLFVSSETHFWSDSLKQRMELAEVKRIAYQQNGSKGGRPRKEQQEQPQEAPKQSDSVEVKPDKQKPVRTKNATIAQNAEESEEVIFLTDLLISEIKKNNPQAKTPANISNWRNDIRLLLADGYDRDQIEKVINWCQADEFWKSNILSAKKLREKIGTLILQMGRKDDAKPWTNSKRPVVEIAKFEGYNESDITPERIEEVRGKAREVEELLRMRKVR